MKSKLTETDKSLSTNYLLVSSSSKAKTIDEAWADYADDVINQFSVIVKLYDDGSEYYTGYLKHENVHMSDILDTAVAYNDITVYVPQQFFS